MSEVDQILVELLDDPSFNRWIKGKSDRAEQKKWEEWCAESFMHEEVRKKAHLLYSLPLEESRDDNLQRELKRLQARIDESNNIFKLPNKIRRPNTSYRWMVAASIAIIIVMISAITLFIQQQAKEIKSEPLYSTFEVGYGEKAKLQFSDGSRIRINSNSSLRYNSEQFNQSQMEVWLEGEAYFSIARNPNGHKRNFIVHTPDGAIRILGTSFNVNTRFGRTGVVLVEGSIEILLKDSFRGVSGKFKLEPGQRAQFSSTQSNVQVQEVDTMLYTAWLDEKIEFKETHIEDIIYNIEQTYGVSIGIEDSTLLDEKISGSLRNPDLKTLFQGLEDVLNVNIIEKKDDFYSITKKRNE